MITKKHTLMGVISVMVRKGMFSNFANPIVFVVFCFEARRGTKSNEKYVWGDVEYFWVFFCKHNDKVLNQYQTMQNEYFCKMSNSGRVTNHWKTLVPEGVRWVSGIWGIPDTHLKPSKTNGKTTFPEVENSIRHPYKYLGQKNGILSTNAKWPPKL